MKPRRFELNERAARWFRAVGGTLVIAWLVAAVVLVFLASQGVSQALAETAVYCFLALLVGLVLCLIGGRESTSDDY